MLKPLPYIISAKFFGWQAEAVRYLHVVSVDLDQAMAAVGAE